MQVPADTPRSPGVFALLHTSTATAYVNETNSLRQRALLWQVKLEDYAKPEPTLPSPAKDFPKHPANEWTWWCVVDGDYAAARAQFEGQGWKIINAYKPRRSYVIVYPDGEAVPGSLAHHCNRLGIKLHTVYKRIDKGMSVEQALGLTDFPPLDKRELAISKMRVQIENENGGLLTYDEALLARPELGDVRDKLKRWRKKHPEVVKIKLSEIAA
jgi:hypothetical protein